MCKSCFLFGHADTPQSIYSDLEQAIKNEVRRGISVFYVGYHGDFDHMAASALRAIKRQYSGITVMLLLSYHPAEKSIETPSDFDGTFYPPMEGIPRKYALIRANQYMVKEADSLICFVNHPGNTRNLLEYAKKETSEKNITNIAEKRPDLLYCDSSGKKEGCPTNVRQPRLNQS